MIIKFQSIIEVWGFLWILIFSTLILGYCCRCNTSDVNVDNSVDSHSTGAPISLSSIHCSLQDSKRTKPTPTSGVLTQSESATRYVAVFDMDGTLCVLLDPYLRQTRWFYAMNHTECPHIWIPWQGDAYLHVFSPHLQILFNYLLEHGVRIAFFSGGRKRRNIVVVPELLRSFWGNERYEALKMKGQFRIHSQDDMRKGNRSFRSREGDDVKDLRLILQDGEALSNAVLVEDDSLYSAHDQKPVILVGTFTELGVDFKEYDALNNVYYLLGLFKTYFENVEYRKLPLRDAMAKILPTNHTDSCCPYPNYDEECEPFSRYFHERHPFVREMVEIGFAAVREVVPHATLYKLFDNRSMTS